jgi:hypothetical protein
MPLVSKGSHHTIDERRPCSDSAGVAQQIADGYHSAHSRKLKSPCLFHNSPSPDRRA